jgi:hypothetical protein
MTALEAKLAQMQWVYYQGQFTTVHDGFGFVMYRQNNQMWVGGLSREDTARARKTHSDGPNRVTVVWNGQWHREPMFLIPATPALVSAVVTSTYPKLGVKTLGMSFGPFIMKDGITYPVQGIR